MSGMREHTPPSMHLAEGKTCADCRHLSTCTHAGNLPGIMDGGTKGDFWCAACGHDLGIRGCRGCCKQTFADIFEAEPCEVGGDVDHGCCYHDQERDVVDIRSNQEGVVGPKGVAA